MALAVTEKQQGKADTANNAYATSSIAPVAGAGYLLWVVGGLTAGTGAVPNVAPSGVTGMGMTWTMVTGTGLPLTGLPSANGTLNISLWRAYTAAPTTGALTVTWPNGVTQDSFAYKLLEVTGMPTTGTQGSNMVVSANIDVFSGATQNPSGALPNALPSGNRMLSALAYNAADLQTITVGSTNAAALVGPVAGRSLNPALQLGVELGGGGTGWDWITSNTSSKAVISVEIAQETTVVGTGPTVTQKITGSQVLAGTTTATTATVAATAGAGYLAWVATGHATLAVSPSTVTGMGMTWVKVTEMLTPNSGVMLTLWRAYTNNPTSTALTITMPAAYTGSVVWKVDEVAGMATTGTNGSGMLRATNVTENAYITTGNVVTTLDQAPLATSTVLSGCAYNAGSTQTLSAGTSGTWALVGGPQQVNNPSVQLAVESGQTVGTSLDWNTTNNSGKTVVVVEIVPAGSTSPLTVNAGADATVDGLTAFTRTALASGGSGGTTFAWAEVTHTGAWAPTLTGAATATVGFTPTADRTGNVITLRVTATDSSGATDTDTVQVTVAPWPHWTRRSGVLAVKRIQTRRGGVLVT